MIQIAEGEVEDICIRDVTGWPGKETVRRAPFTVTCGYLKSVSDAAVDVSGDDLSASDDKYGTAQGAHTA